MKVNECEKGKQTCGKIYSFLKAERGRSLKIPAVYMCEIPLRIKCKLIRHTITTEETNVGIRDRIVTQDKQYKMLSITGCNGEA